MRGKTNGGGAEWSKSLPHGQFPPTMKRCLQILALCVAALLAVRMMAQDTGGGNGGGDTSGGSENSGGATGAGASGATGNTGGGNGNGNTSGGQNGNGNGDQNGNGNGMGTTPGTGDLFGPAPGTEGTPGGGSTILPAPSAAPAPSGTLPWAGVTPSPTPATANPFAPGAQATPPVTFTLPAGYGGSAAQSFTLGQGRLAKPPITFTLSVTEGYDDNIFSASGHIAPTPTPVPSPTPVLQFRVIGFRITLPAPPVPILQGFRPTLHTSPTPKPVQQLGIIGSQVSTATLGIQIQKGTPRTILTMDANLAEQIYWQQPGGKEDYNGSFDTSYVHRLTPRATLTLSMSAVYQKQPNFSLINAPTTNNGSGGDYLNGSAKIDLSYQWTARLSTVSSYSLGANLLATNASSNQFGNTIGTQFRYTVSARNTVTAELRESTTTYPTNAAANSSSTFLLLGLESIISPNISNRISGGLESDVYPSGQGNQTVPYMESATTLMLPRGAALQWTNRLGSESSGSPDSTVFSYRTGLTYSQPLSTKLVASVSLAYNYVEDNAVGTSGSNAAASYTQEQLQATLGLNYTVTPRFSLNLSYTYNDLLSTQANSSYDRIQFDVGGTYLFQ